MNATLREELRQRIDAVRRDELGIRRPDRGTEAECAAAIASLREFAIRVGHAPRAKRDLRSGGLPSEAELVRIFGSVTEAYVAAGLPAPRRGYWRPVSLSTSDGA